MPRAATQDEAIHALAELARGEIDMAEASRNHSHLKSIDREIDGVTYRFSAIRLCTGWRTYGWRGQHEKQYCRGHWPAGWERPISVLGTYPTPEKAMEAAEDAVRMSAERIATPRDIDKVRKEFGLTR